MRARKPFLATLLSVAIFLLSSCTGGSGGGPPAPMFASSPVLQASQGDLYSYLISATDPSGGTVTFELSEGPEGATLSGSTLSWTPSAAESRVANNFTVTAKSSGGGTAMQSWTVTPSGTVVVSRIDVHWTASGQVAVPFDWTQAPNVAAQVAALVPQGDGTIRSLSGTGNADGTLDIPGVPGGFYFLRLGPGLSYWTSQSAVDIGSDISGPGLSAANSQSTTTFNVMAGGLDGIEVGDWVELATDIGFDLPENVGQPVGGTTTAFQVAVVSNIDFSKTQSAFLQQFEPASAGGLNFLTLGPQLTVSNLQLVDGAVNAFNVNLVSAPKMSVDLSVKGLAWGTLMESSAPGQVMPVEAEISAYEEAYVTGVHARPESAFERSGPTLFLPDPAGDLIPLVSSSVCADFVSGGLSNTSGNPQAFPPIITDQDFGSVSFEDPFPANWTREFNFCQGFATEMALPNSNQTATFNLWDGQITTLPSAALVPLLSAPQNPTINGISFFAPGTTNSAQITLSWNPPATGSPFGYFVRPFVLETLPDGTMALASAGRYGTATTSLTLPFLLKPGQTAIFVITAEVDGRAKMDSQPNRSALPVAFASIVSAPVTVSATAQLPPMAAGSAAARRMFFEAVPQDADAQRPRAEIHRTR